MRAFVDKWKAVEGKRVVLVTVSYIVPYRKNLLMSCRVGELPFH